MCATVHERNSDIAFSLLCADGNDGLLSRLVGFHRRFGSRTACVAISLVVMHSTAAYTFAPTTATVHFSMNILYHFFSAINYPSTCACHHCSRTAYRKQQTTTIAMIVCAIMVRYTYTRVTSPSVDRCAIKTTNATRKYDTINWIAKCENERQIGKLFFFYLFVVFRSLSASSILLSFTPPLCLDTYNILFVCSLSISLCVKRRIMECVVIVGS